MTTSILQLNTDGHVLAAVPAPTDMFLMADVSEALTVNKTKAILYSYLVNLAAQSALQALVTSQAAGDLFYASSATALSRLALSTVPYSKLRVNAAHSAPEWGGSLPRVTVAASSTTPTPNCDTTDEYEIDSLSDNCTFGAPTGTPINGQKLMIITLASGARTLAWNAIYVAHGTVLPASLASGKWMHIGFRYNSTLTKWVCPMAKVIQS